MSPRGRLLQLREAGRLVGTEPHLTSGPQRRASLGPGRGLLARDPDIALRVDVGLEALPSLDRDLDDPDDGPAGPEAFDSLKHGGLAGEDNPPLSVGFPCQDAASGQVDRVDARPRAGTFLVLGRDGRDQRHRNQSRQYEARPCAAPRTASGLVVLSHGSSQGTTRRFAADSLPWPNRD